MNKQMSSALVQGDNTPVVLVGEDGNKIETITSMEVAEMMEVDHSNLLKKIDNITASLVKVNFDFYKYWKESTYINQSNNKTCRCFDVTKFGCEFLANKMTGDKGNIFTAKYIERFHAMEDYIKQEQIKPMCIEDAIIESMKLQKELKEQLNQVNCHALEAKAQSQEVKQEIEDMKDSMPLFKIECDDLVSMVKKKATHILGGYKSNAYNDKSILQRVYKDIYAQINREFCVEKCSGIKRKDFDIAKQFVEDYKAPMVLVQDINLANSQTTLFDKDKKEA